MRIAAFIDLALVSLTLMACAQASARHPPPKAPDAKIAGPARPGAPYFGHPTCTWEHWGVFGAWMNITASGVEDIPAMCGNLWAALHKFPGCRMLTHPSCGGADGYMEWRFHAPGFTCDFGLIRSAWYSATGGNRLGVLDCDGAQPETQPDPDKPTKTKPPKVWSTKPLKPKFKV
ncbi:hypothetical protein LY76DRAFT_524823 [Colletotrichum caudatum]|nr:hypothetical protein LY76DRAFT_524823 [Colletotrichum caudatum]